MGFIGACGCGGGGGVVPKQLMSLEAVVGGRWWGAFGQLVGQCAWAAPLRIARACATLLRGSILGEFQVTAYVVAVDRMGTTSRRHLAEF